MSDADRIAAFLRLADEELQAARLLARSAPRQAAYFVQQAAEKASRAVLTHALVPFGTGHNLAQMASALPQDHALRMRLNSLDKYSTAATKYRYPSPAGRLPEPPNQSALTADIDDVAAFIGEVKRHIGTR